MFSLIKILLSLYNINFLLLYVLTNWVLFCLQTQENIPWREIQGENVYLPLVINGDMLVFYPVPCKKVLITSDKIFHYIALTRFVLYYDLVNIVLTIFFHMYSAYIIILLTNVLEICHVQYFYVVFILKYYIEYIVTAARNLYSDTDQL